MSFFTTKTKVIEMDAENSVIVRDVTYGEEQDIRSQCLKMRAGMRMQGKNGPQDEENTQAEVTFDSVQQGRLTLYAQVVDWSGPGFADENGQKIPVTPKNIDRLSAGIVNKILKGIEEAFKPLTDEEKN